MHVRRHEFTAFRLHGKFSDPKEYELVLHAFAGRNTQHLRPNPDGRINRKPDGRIFYQTAELIKNQTCRIWPYSQIIKYYNSYPIYVMDKSQGC